MLPCLSSQEIVMLSVKAGINSGIARMGVTGGKNLEYMAGVKKERF